MSTGKVRLRRTIVVAAIFTASAAFVVPASAHAQSGTKGAQGNSSPSVAAGPKSQPITVPYDSSPSVDVNPSSQPITVPYDSSPLVTAQFNPKEIQIDP